MVSSEYLFNHTKFLKMRLRYMFQEKFSMPYRYMISVQGKLTIPEERMSRNLEPVLSDLAVCFAFLQVE